MKARILHDLEDAACGDHPTLLIARKGEVGEIVDKAGTWSAYIRLADGRVVGCSYGEYEVLAAEAEGDGD